MKPTVINITLDGEELTFEFKETEEKLILWVDPDVEDPAESVEMRYAMTFPTSSEKALAEAKQLMVWASAIEYMDNNLDIQERAGMGDGDDAWVEIWVIFSDLCDMVTNFKTK